MTISYSTKYFRFAKDDTPSLLPDIPAEPSSADYFAGRDPALEAILNYQAE